MTVGGLVYIRARLPLAAQVREEYSGVKAQLYVLSPVVRERLTAIVLGNGDTKIFKGKHRGESEVADL